MAPIATVIADLDFSSVRAKSVQSRLKSWMQPFRGVATKSLQNYLGWHRLIDRGDRPLAPAACLAAAVN